MEEYGKLIGLMVIGAALIFLFKGVLEVRATGDDWRFGDFIRSNVNRLMLLACLLVFSSLGLWLDPVGIAELFAQLPVSIQVASPLVLGAALSGVVMIFNRNEVPPNG